MDNNGDPLNVCTAVIAVEEAARFCIISAEGYMQLHTFSRL